MKTYTKKEQERFAQLTNDIAEDMNMRSWKRQDLIDCINFLQDQNCKDRNEFMAFRSNILLALAKSFPEKSCTTSLSPLLITA